MHALEFTSPQWMVQFINNKTFQMVDGHTVWFSWLPSSPLILTIHGSFWMILGPFLENSNKTYWAWKPCYVHNVLLIKLQENSFLKSLLGLVSYCNFWVCNNINLVLKNYEFLKTILHNSIEKEGTLIVHFNKEKENFHSFLFLIKLYSLACIARSISSISCSSRLPFCFPK